MIVKEIPTNIRCLEYRQDKADTDYGSCLYARFYFNLDRWELNIISDVGNYAYQWVATPDHESFLELMARITDGYLLGKLCGTPKVFDYEATKAHFYDYADDGDNKKHLDEIFEEIECKYIPDNGETFIELFEQENDGWWCDAWEYLIYRYTAWQEKIVSVFKNHIQPVIRKMIKSESEDERIMMSLEEAKKIFLNRGYIEVSGGTYYDADKWRDAITVISKWLEQGSCEDCISRQEALNVVHRYFEHYLQLNDDICLDGLRSLPSVTPKEKTGMWINDWEMGMSECSCCGETYLWEDHKGTENFHYCPNCGARMTESEDKE